MTSHGPHTGDAPGARSCAPTRMVWGLPLALGWGYVSVALFMTGDGIEVTFLSRYVTDTGFSARDAALLFSAFGATAAVSGWLSGILAEVYGARHVMLVGAAWWVLCQVAFLKFGIEASSYQMMLLFYALRGFAHPLFFYAFFLRIVQVAPQTRLASALGWLWSVYTIGYGVLATFIAGIAIPHFGVLPTLWMSLFWIVAGAVVAFFAVTSAATPDRGAGGSGRALRQALASLPVIIKNRDIAIMFFLRVVSNLSLYGFPVVMPLFYTSAQGGFSMAQWMMVYGVYFFVQPFGNVAWGLIGDRIGWIRQLRWAGFFGCALTTLLFYYVPLFAPGNMVLATGAAVLAAVTVTSFVAISALFPALVPSHKGGAVSIQNLGGGLSNFLGPALAAGLVTHWGVQGVIVAYAALYTVAGGMTFFLRFRQPGF
ncbi:MAG: MFS transporter [Acetobacter sp.]